MISLARLFFCIFIIIANSVFSQKIDTAYFTRYGIYTIDDIDYGNAQYLILCNNATEKRDVPLEIQNADSCYLAVLDSNCWNLKQSIETVTIYKVFRKGVASFYYQINKQLIPIDKQQLQKGVEIALKTKNGEAKIHFDIFIPSKNKEYGNYEMGNIINLSSRVDESHYLEIQFRNYWIADIISDKDSASIVLFDENSNGKYTDKDDYISIQNYGKSNFTIWDDQANTSKVADGKTFSIKDSRYEILELNPEKGFITFTKTSKEPIIRNKINVSNLLVRTENDELISIKDLSNGQYLCLSFWIEACVPCLSKLPLLSELSVENKDNIKIAGALLCEDMKDLHRIKERYGAQFLQLLWPKELNDLFNVSGYPKAALIDPEGYIITVNYDTELIKK